MAMNKMFNMYMKSERFAESSAHEYTVIINDFLNYVGKAETEITVEDVAEWRESLEVYSTATIAKKITCVKTYFRFLEDYDVIEKNPTKRLRSPEVVNKEKHHMTIGQVSAMVNACTNLRDRAIIILAATSGMRVSEFTNITLDQYNAMRSEGKHRFNIVGKGNKTAPVVINEEACEAIDKYLKVRCDYGTGNRNLILSDTGKTLSDKVANQMLKRVAKAAGIEWYEDMTCHQLRAATATILSDAGIPVMQIRDVMRHANASTTNRYIKASSEEIENNVMGIHIGL